MPRPRAKGSIAHDHDKWKLVEIHSVAIDLLGDHAYWVVEVGCISCKQLDPKKPRDEDFYWVRHHNLWDARRDDDGIFHFTRPDN